MHNILKLIQASDKRTLGSRFLFKKFQGFSDYNRHMSKAFRVQELLEF